MIDVYNFKSHKKFKRELLKLINNIPKTKLNTNKIESLNHTDWYLPPETSRAYWSLFKDLLKDWKTHMCFKTHSKRCLIHNYWFQQYLKNDHHNWHNHSACQFSSVYYLELSNSKMATEFFEGSKINVKEGDIITFPSYLYHRSPINKINKRKTVIVFNSSFEQLNLEY